jgi:hypothetical protein
LNPIDYIKSKQKIWAQLRNISLVGSQNKTGDKVYTKTLDENLFKVMEQETLESFKDGDGNELGNGIIPGKMQALHSSSALVVNAFDYWKSINDKSSMAKSLYIPSIKISRISFEKKYPIINDSNVKSPNVDVVIEYENKDCCAIECKFTEPFNNRQREHGLKERYFEDSEIWDTIPNIRRLVSNDSKKIEDFKKLHAEQLIKHILGLLTYYNYRKDRFRLIYLYYDVFGEDGYIHGKEIEEFKEIVKRDEINFQAISWQEFICNLCFNCSNQHNKYTKYLFERYI